MRRTFFSGLVTAAFIAAAGSISSVPASAAIVTATYKGTVSYGYDSTGVFGALTDRRCLHRRLQDQ
jgi:hypothetical protein